MPSSPFLRLRPRRRLDQRSHHALGGLGLVAQKLGRAELLAQREPDRLGRGLAGARPGLARLGALALHGRIEASRSTPMFARFQRVLREVEREAIGVVELESHLAGQPVARLERRGLASSSIPSPRASVLRKRVSSSLSVSPISAWPRISSG